MKRRPNKLKTRAYEFKDVCENKRRFADEKTAREAANFRMLENMNVELTVYLCLSCGGWHLTRVKRDAE